MDSNEALDRELIVERAEALRAWLRDQPIAEHIAEALERELVGILANDPGGYINGQRPLAGLTIADFIADLQRPGGGTVARVRNLGAESLAELRAVLADDAPPPRMAPPQITASNLPPPAVEQPFSNPFTNGHYVEPVGSAANAPDEAAAPEATTDTPPAGPASPGLEAAVTATERPAISPALPVAAPAELGVATEDAALKQLLQLWPSLHPQARRAVVLYTSTLLVESLIADAS